MSERGDAAADARDAAAEAGVDGRPPSVAPGARVLLYGVGNDLRGDDGAGPRVARALEGRVDWRVSVVHGLTPELADDLAECDVALFVDADADLTLERPVWRRHPHAGVSPGGRGAGVFNHALDVPALLALTWTLHARAPEAATLSLPARDVARGEALSPAAAAGVERACAALLRLARV